VSPQAVPVWEPLAMDRLSKIVYYLIDNQYTDILSWVECESKRKSGGAGDLVPIWEFWDSPRT
jgi:hypothetical protein